MLPLGGFSGSLIHGGVNTGARNCNCAWIISVPDSHRTEEVFSVLFLCSGLCDLCLALELLCGMEESLLCSDTGLVAAVWGHTPTLTSLLPSHAPVHLCHLLGPRGAGVQAGQGRIWSSIGR